MHSNLDITALFLLVNLDQGRCLGSKSVYRQTHRPNRFVPNSGIYLGRSATTARPQKIWYGDLDLLDDGRALANVSRHLGRKLFILTEADHRWRPERLSSHEVRRRAVATIWRGEVVYSAPIEPHGGSWW